MIACKYGRNILIKHNRENTKSLEKKKEMIAKSSSVTFKPWTGEINNFDAVKMAPVKGWNILYKTENKQSIVKLDNFLIFKQ